jgi:AcrR family transcriptional regulator
MTGVGSNTTSAQGGAAKSGGARDAIIESMMRLAARREFADVTISDIAREAGISLAYFRDNFPSKGAVLSGFSRKIDRKVLDGMEGECDTGTARERLYNVLRRRLMALEPYREALESIARWTSGDAMAATALNREVVNSMRFMLEAADIECEGPVGALKLQGLAFSWSRVLDAWFEHSDRHMAHALTALDRELERGEKWVDRAEDVMRLTEPFRSIAGQFFSGFKKRTRRHHHAHHRHSHSGDDYDETYDSSRAGF